jgi:hypothetical protein
MVTRKADNRQRVMLPDAKPGQLFAYEVVGNVIHLTPVKPVEPESRPSMCKLVKRDGFTVIHTDKVVSQETIDELLTSLP